MSEVRRAPNMADVAARAGVSHQTVWRVVNGIAGVRPATRDRVLAVIDELGFRRNLSARRLVAGRSRAIGVLAPATPNFGPTSSLYAVERAIREAGYHPLLASAEPTDAQETLGFLLDQSVEALVVIAPHRTILRAIGELRSEVVTAVLQAGDTDVGTSVAIDQAAGVRAELDHLAELGHRTIQHIAGPVEFIEAELRRDAFQAEIARRGFEALPVLEGDWSAESGYRVAAHLDPRATAIVSGNDQMAFGVIHALADAGRSVPGEVSVVGFDDIPEAAHSIPPLTTVHQDFAEVGRRAVAALLARLDGEDAAAPPLEPTLIVRASTAPVR